MTYTDQLCTFWWCLPKFLYSF